MERKRSIFQAIAAAAGFLVLIFDSSLAQQGARSGLELCIKTVIPSLFPFFVLSALLTSSFSGCGHGFTYQFSKMMGIPRAAASLLVPAFLGGYPVGAKCVWDLYRRKQVSQTEAERLLAFSSNAGPSFLFGVVSGFFPKKSMVWLLWLIHILSALLTAVSIPSVNSGRYSEQSQKQIKEETIILSAAKAMAMVCCWVILFRTILTFLNAWFLWIFPDWFSVLLTGILELTNGCCALLQISDADLRFVLCACMLSLGGVCVLLQTASVTKGLSLKGYVSGKIIQTVFSFLLSSALTAEHGFFYLICIPFFVLILRKIQNTYSNPGIIPV